MKGIHDVIRETLDDSVMQETGRSVGDLASSRVATRVIEALQREGYEIEIRFPRSVVGEQQP